MKKTTLTMLLIVFVGLLCLTSCSKDDEKEEKSSYTPEQLATLKVLHGSFSNTPDIMTGNIKTTFIFTETFLNEPKNIVATNYYGEKLERPIHGYLTYKYDYPNSDDFEAQMAYYLSTNGTDMTLYHTNSDKTISLNSSPEKYKVVIINDNQIRLIDMDFPYDAGQYYNRDN